MRKKGLLMLISIMIFVLIGCSNGEVENSLASRLESDDRVEKVIFKQGMVSWGNDVMKGSSEDYEQMIEIFSKISSDGEPFEEYKSAGFYNLISPRICIVYASGNNIEIEWDIHKGILVYNEDEYYIDKMLGKELYEIFTKYNPLVNGGII